MRAIETIYKGHRFRSRTEARWAVFFSAINYRWEYEPQGYLLDSKTPYLPDFKLIFSEERVIYCSIKAEESDDFDAEELRKLHLLADGTSKEVILLSGRPTLRSYNMVRPDSEPNVLCAVFFKDYKPFVGKVDEYWHQSLNMDPSTGRDYFSMNERRAGKAFGKGYIKALREAQGARFEHGETPG